ncbi:hypothetical protein GCM10009737_12700 [Nocardioides lentus]|uniref:N-acetyltransferase domain-containing protein n=1 Tax=Nocardioides lentus TaxID=338077 RepID=A0ABN2P883_9ACTN
MTQRPTADVSVRVAWGDDAPAIARVQARAWPDMWGDTLPAEALTLDVDAAAQAWRTSMATPPDARVRVLVALERNRTAGYAVTAPASDPDLDPVASAELLDLVIDPAERGLGHGSRLVQAVVDTVVADRFTHLVTWAGTDDTALRDFLDRAGWAADGARRQLDLDGSGAHLLTQVRLHTTVG